MGQKKLKGQGARGEIVKGARSMPPPILEVHRLILGPANEQTIYWVTSELRAGSSCKKFLPELVVLPSADG